MARGRMILNSISLDEKVNSLSSDSCRLLFTWMITHLDREGRIYGEPGVVKGLVFPRLHHNSIRKVAKMLQELHDIGLIICYTDVKFFTGSSEKRQTDVKNYYISFPNFELHQPGMRKEREPRSRIPQYVPEGVRKVADNHPAEVKVSEVKLSEVKGKLAEIATLYETEIGMITPMIKDELVEISDKYPLEWFKDSVKIMRKAGVRNLRYILKILERWEVEGKGDRKGKKKSKWDIP